MTITPTTVQIPVADGTTMAAYLVRPNDDPAPVGVIVAHELFAVGEDDALIDTEQRNQIRTALGEAHIEHELVSYPNVEHAFFWPNTPMFNQKARDDTWDRILSMLAD